MRRFLALVIVTAFLAGPTNRLMCLISCDDAAHRGRVPQVEHCHTDSDSGPTLGARAAHCRADAIPVTFTAKRTEAKSPTLVGSSGDRPVLTSLDRPETGATLAAEVVASPPPKLLIPLRI
jgi:hypothetical protein